MTYEIHPHDAGGLRLGLLFGVMSVDDVITFIDQRITRLAIPSPELCELSMSRDTVALSKGLGFFEVGSAFIDKVCALLFRLIDVNLMQKTTVHTLMSNIASLVDWDDTTALRDFKILDHELCDAKMGVCASVAEVEEDIILAIEALV